MGLKFYQFQLQQSRHAQWNRRRNQWWQLFARSTRRQFRATDETRTWSIYRVSISMWGPVLLVQLRNLLARIRNIPNLFKNKAMLTFTSVASIGCLTRIYSNLWEMQDACALLRSNLIPQLNSAVPWSPRHNSWKFTILSFENVPKIFAQNFRKV